MLYAVTLRGARGAEEVVEVEAESGDEAAEKAFTAHHVILGVHPIQPVYEAESEAPPEVVPNPLAPIRAEYKDVVGKAPFNGWDEATLREKIEAAKVAAAN